MTRSPTRGVLLVLAAAMLWGTTGTAQSLAPTTLSPLWVGTGRLLIAALFFVALLGLTQGRALAASMRGGLPWAGIAAAALCMTVYNLAFFAGVRASGIAVGTAVALGSGPVWAGLLQILLGGGSPRGGWWIGTALAVGGGALMVLGPGGATAVDGQGIALCLLAGLSYAVYATLNQRLVAGVAPGLVTGTVFTLAALLALPPAVALAGSPVSPAGLVAPDLGRSLAVFVWLGVAATGIAYLCFSHALRHIPAATAVTLALAEPLTAFVLALVLVGERPGSLAFVGLAGLLIGLGVVMRTAAPRSGRSPT